MNSSPSSAPAVASRFLHRLEAVAGEARWKAATSAGETYVKYAAELDQPDKVAEGSEDWKAVLDRFYTDFKRKLEKAAADDDGNLGAGLHHVADLPGDRAHDVRVDAEAEVARERLTGQLEQDTLVGWRGDGHGQFLQWLMVFGG